MYYWAPILYSVVGRRVEMDKQQYLLDRVKAWLGEKGYKFGHSPDNMASSLDFAAAFKKQGDVPLIVEVRIMNAYRSREFRALVGDAILRNLHGDSGSKGEGRLLLAVLLKRMSPIVVKDLQDYAKRYLPSLNWLVMDEFGQGNACLDSHEESFALPDALRRQVDNRMSVSRGNLFSPKNQWLLKILLLAGLDRRYWGGPSRLPQSINELASISGVSQPSVSVFVMNAERAGFLKRSRDGFQILRCQELLDEWFYAVKNRRHSEIGVRSLYGEEPGEVFSSKIRAFCQKAVNEGAGPALVVGHHLACHLLKLGRSNVRFAKIYANRPVEGIMSALDLARDESADPQMILAVPPVSQPVLAGHVGCEGIPVCDVLQCYLDVRSSLARGNEQAEFILEKILMPHFEGRTLC
jgi:hypothetical protein